MKQWLASETSVDFLIEDVGDLLTSPWLPWGLGDHQTPTSTTSVSFLMLMSFLCVLLQSRIWTS